MEPLPLPQPRHWTLPSSHGADLYNEPLSDGAEKGGRKYGGWNSNFYQKCGAFWKTGLPLRFHRQSCVRLLANTDVTDGKSFTWMNQNPTSVSYKQEVENLIQAELNLHYCS